MSCGTQIFTSNTGSRPDSKPRVLSRILLLVWIDWPLVLRLHFVAFPPLPVVVAVVVDFLDRDRGFRRDVVRKIVRPLVDLVVIRLLLETRFASFVFCQRLGVARDVLDPASSR